MSEYNLSHLTQDSRQYVGGPIQDDEALVLYSIIKCMRIKTVLETGGDSGYSAKNFTEAVGPDGLVFCCDIKDVPKQADNHIFVKKDAKDITADDLGNTLIELIFFDCHAYEAQMKLFYNLKNSNLIDDDTILAFHDTNTHPKVFAWENIEIENGLLVHQPVERRMVNTFTLLGYHAICFHPKNSKHNNEFPFRHGLTIMKKFKPLINDKHGFSF